MPQPSIGRTFNPRSNALNLLRLCFALLVIFSHSIVLGGYPRSESLWGNVSLGQIAVSAFFSISGFLIAASAARTTVARYFWQRFLRIFPAFWVCIILTAAIAGPIGWVSQGNTSLGNYLTASGGPVRYVIANWFLLIRQTGIARTPDQVPYPQIWNGSLWTLWPEFMCYVLLGVLAMTGILARRRIVLGLWLLSWVLAVVASVAGGSKSGQLGQLVSEHMVIHLALILIKFTPIFLAGSVLWLYRDKVPDSGLLFGVALLIFVGGTFLPAADLLAPPLAYICIWASIHMPGKSIGSKYDISYGVYIYAFVVAQIFAIYKIHERGYVAYTALTVAVTVALAWLSCVFVEQPALRLKHWTPSFIQRSPHRKV